MSKLCSTFGSLIGGRARTVHSGPTNPILRRITLTFKTLKKTDFALSNAP
jgi:hypothetical protein